MKLIIDIPEDVYTRLFDNGIQDNEIAVDDVCEMARALRMGIPYAERPQGECKTCRHRDPEDKKCDCGGKERQGCPFPVSDDYYCKYYEKGGAE